MRCWVVGQRSKRVIIQNSPKRAEIPHPDLYVNQPIKSWVKNLPSMCMRDRDKSRRREGREKAIRKNAEFGGFPEYKDVTC